MTLTLILRHFGKLGIFLLLVLGLGGSTLAQLNAEDYYRQCVSLLNQGAPESARATCELALVMDNSHLPSLKLVAGIHLNQGRLAEAKPYLDRLASLAPGDPEVRLLLSREKLLERKPKEALDLLLDLPGEEAALRKGQALEALGRYEDALARYRSATTLAEARIGAARLSLRLGRPDDGLGLLGSTPKEAVLKAELLRATGRLPEAAELAETNLPLIDPTDPDYSRSLRTLALTYYGLGNFSQGGLVLRQLSSRESILNAVLVQTWPYLLVLLLYLGLLLLGESRIEPMRTVEMVSNLRIGAGTLHLWLAAAILASGLVAAWLGQSLYNNWLAMVTPVQAALIQPVFFLVLGMLALLAVYRRAGAASLNLGPSTNWIEGAWAGLVLVVLLLVYGFIRRSLGLLEMPLLYPAFLGLACLEPVIRGAGAASLKDRYRDLALYMVPLLSGLAMPGPTLYFVAAGIFLSWLARRTGGTLAGTVAWVFAGLVVTLAANIPILRTLL